MTTAICIASGPSLTQADVDLCRGHGEVIVVNDNYKLAPWADVLYACDCPWWDLHKGVPEFKGEKITYSAEAAALYNLEHFVFEYTGGNSGFQAIVVAIARGAKRIILLGYDMKPAEDGKRHWFGEHPPSMVQASNYKGWVTNFANWAEKFTAQGVEIINCTRDSALECFEKMDLKEALMLGEFNKKRSFDSRESHLRYALSQADNKGLALEFGVHKGKTLKIIDQNWRGRIYGFDSFEGLPEDWDVGTPERPHPVGTFKCEKPSGFSMSVKLVEGWFTDTVPDWKFDCEDDISFLHIDSDLYSSAKFVLSQLDSRIVPGTVICFDELLNFKDGWYVNWKEGEWKALHEWLKSYQREVKVLSRSAFNQAAVMVTK